MTICSRSSAPFAALSIVASASSLAAGGPAPATSTASSSSACAQQAEAYARAIAVQMSALGGVSSPVIGSDGETSLLESGDPSRQSYEVALQVAADAEEWPSHDVYEVTLQVLGDDECVFESIRLVETFI